MENRDYFEVSNDIDSAILKLKHTLNILKDAVGVDLSEHVAVVEELIDDLKHKSSELKSQKVTAKEKVFETRLEFNTREKIVSTKKAEAKIEIEAKWDIPEDEVEAAKEEASKIKETGTKNPKSVIEIDSDGILHIPYDYHDVYINYTKAKTGDSIEKFIEFSTTLFTDDPVIQEVEIV